MSIVSRRLSLHVIGLLLAGLILPCASQALDLSKVLDLNKNDVTSSMPQLDHITLKDPVKLEDHAQAKKIQTYSGKVTLGEHALAKSIKTNQGDIQVGANSQVSGSVESRSGSITLDQAKVDGSVTTSNGNIELKKATVSGDVQTSNGDITIGAESTVNGGIKVVKDKNKLGKLLSRTPTVVIGPKAVVKGPLNFAHDTRLQVSDSAQIGEVSGAKVEKFSGDQP